MKRKGEMGIWKERRSRIAFAVVIATLIPASTLTKQRYFVEVIAGLGVAVLCRLLVSKMALRRSGAREFLNGRKARQNL
jgi:uncharacterized membrane protein YcaP (DUF421 family)